MRILKYLFLLLLLVLVAITVFVSTSKGTFNVERSRVIPMQRSVLFSYVSDFRNWNNFGPWVSGDFDADLKFPAVTTGKGASFSWSTYEGEGKLTTKFVRENDSIFQQMDFNGAASAVSWKFKDTVGGTKVTWRAKGRMSFMYKVRAVTNGGIQKLISAISEQSLIDLEKTLAKEISTFAIYPNGIKVFPEVKYLKQSITSKIDLAPANIRIMLAKMDYFFRKNNIKASGKPFVRFEKYDAPNNICRFSVCIPIPEEVHISDGSDVQYGKMPKLSAVKVTLKGDLSHIAKARKSANDYMKANNLVVLPKYRWIEVASNGILQTNRPSQWVTELYYPVGVYASETPQTTENVTTPSATTTAVRRPAPVVRDTTSQN